MKFYYKKQVGPNILFEVDNIALLERVGIFCIPILPLPLEH